MSVVPISSHCKHAPVSLGTNQDVLIVDVADANKQGDVSLIGTGGLTNAIQAIGFSSHYLTAGSSYSNSGQEPVCRNVADTGSCMWVR